MHHLAPESGSARGTPVQSPSSTSTARRRSHAVRSPASAALMTPMVDIDAVAAIDMVDSVKVKTPSSIHELQRLLDAKRSLASAQARAELMRASAQEMDVSLTRANLKRKLLMGDVATPSSLNSLKSSACAGTTGNSLTPKRRRRTPLDASVVDAPPSSSMKAPLTMMSASFAAGSSSTPASMLRRRRRRSSSVAPSSLSSSSSSSKAMTSASSSRRTRRRSSFEGLELLRGNRETLSFSDDEEGQLPSAPAQALVPSTLPSPISTVIPSSLMVASSGTSESPTKVLSMPTVGHSQESLISSSSSSSFSMLMRSGSSSSSSSSSLRFDLGDSLMGPPMPVLPTSSSSSCSSSFSPTPSSPRVTENDENTNSETNSAETAGAGGNTPILGSTSPSIRSSSSGTSSMPTSTPASTLTPLLQLKSKAPRHSQLSQHHQRGATTGPVRAMPRKNSTPVSSTREHSSPSTVHLRTRSRTMSLDSTSHGSPSTSLMSPHEHVQSTMGTLEFPTPLRRSLRLRRRSHSTLSGHGTAARDSVLGSPASAYVTSTSQQPSIAANVCDPYDMSAYDDNTLNFDPSRVAGHTPSSSNLKSIVTSLFSANNQAGASPTASGARDRSVSSTGSRGVSKKRSRKQASDSQTSPTSASGPSRKKAHVSRNSLEGHRIQHSVDVAHFASHTLRSGNRKKRKRSDGNAPFSPPSSAYSNVNDMRRKKHAAAGISARVVNGKKPFATSHVRCPLQPQASGSDGKSDAEESDWGMEIVRVAKPLVSFPEIYGLSASRLLTDEFAKHLKLWHPFRFIDVIFRASQHNFSADRFHAICDSPQSRTTVVLVKVRAPPAAKRGGDGAKPAPEVDTPRYSTIPSRKPAKESKEESAEDYKGNFVVFGGLSVLPWSGPRVKDPSGSCFLFNLTNNERFPLKQPLTGGNFNKKNKSKSPPPSSSQFVQMQDDDPVLARDRDMPQHLPSLTLSPSLLSTASTSASASRSAPALGYTAVAPLSAHKAPRSGSQTQHPRALSHFPRAITPNPKYGPTFGRADLYLCDRCDREEWSGSVRHSYDMPTPMALCGQKRFKVLEYEVLTLE